MMKRTAIFICAVLLLSGCTLFNRSKTELATYSSSTIKELLLKAVNGDVNSNNKLSGIINLNFPVNNNYNSIIVDSVELKAGKKYFIVLINYPNPVYNRFAVYDSFLNLYLIDKSLNGYLDESVLRLNDFIFVKISEDFASKDVIKLNRISLFSIDNSGVNLAFRSFTKLTEPKIAFNQKIAEFSPGQIVTELSSSKKPDILNKADTFIYDTTRKKYISQSETFDNFVIKYIKDFKSNSDKPEITDKKSLYASVGIDIGLDTIKNTSNAGESGYSLTLTDNWKTIKDILITEFLKTPLKGTKYINDVVGARISVIELPAGDTAEKYIDFRLDKSSSGNYRVRYSDKIESKIDYVQFFEFTYNSKKFLLILSASKYTYDKFKDDYKGIIDSFAINS